MNFVAEFSGKLIGNIMYSVAYVLSPNGERHEVLTFGPLTVLPQWQRRGVGITLMRHTLKLAAKMGFGAVIIFGHPTYYPRIGFKEAKEFGITTSWGENFPAFMALELMFGGLDGITGAMYYTPCMDVDAAKAREFDLGFAAL